MSCGKLREIFKAESNDDCFSNATSAKENGKKFSFDNRNRKTICRVRVDACLITNNAVKKCDYLFQVYEDNKYYLIELKGGAVDVAVEQIISTYDIVNPKIGASPENYSGVIVSSSVPAGTEQRFRKLQERSYKERRLKITKTHMQHIEKV